jgi:hypothetical protein
LAVDVRAPSPDFFFNVLRDSIEDLITRRWPGLGYQLLVPCPTMNADGSRCPSAIPLAGLLAYREEGDSHYRCMGCRAKHDISSLLTGFTSRGRSLQPELDQMQAQLIKIKKGVERVEGYAADSAASMRRILGAVESEITDCPMLFTVTRSRPKAGLRRLRFDQQHYRLTLWCEHPGHWHPWPAASYPIASPKERLAQILPYAVLILKALKIAMPMTGPLADMILTDQQLNEIKNQLDLMESVIAEIPDAMPPLERGSMIPDGSSDRLSPAEGQAARALRLLLFGLDEKRAFGDMRRVQSPSGDFLWVCANHYPEYDPGLPVIPTS